MFKVLVCPECNSDDFNIIVDSNLSIDGNTVLNFQCSGCGENAQDLIEEVMYSMVN